MLVGAVLTIMAAAGCAPASTVTVTPSPAVASGPVTGQAGIHRVHDPGQVTGTLTGPCAYRQSAAGELPDPRCTPGAADPAVTQASIASTICKTGWTATVRPPEAQTSAFKYGQAYPAYGLPRTTRTELDHLVPLELGGANDASNLWPQSPPTPNPKDKVEGTLRAAVCAGKVKLAAAQQAIARNWTTAERVLGISG